MAPVWCRQADFGVALDEPGRWRPGLQAAWSLQSDTDGASACVLLELKIVKERSGIFCILCLLSWRTTKHKIFRG
jgi:hypothetical protein